MAKGWTVILWFPLLCIAGLLDQRLETEPLLVFAAIIAILTHAIYAVYVNVQRIKSGFRDIFKN